MNFSAAYKGVTMAGSRISRSSAPHGERGLSVRRRFSTSTVADHGRLVPWLAASGPLSYTPEDPPSRDYYFQYGWILPEIFTPSARNRRHFYFGASVKDHADELFAFWRAARESAAVLVACHLGSADASTRVTAPVAVYSARDFRGRTGYLCPTTITPPHPVASPGNATSILVPNPGSVFVRETQL